MIWLNPFALFGLAAVAAPLLIHLLVHRRAERFPFPTLRFLRLTRLASIRRHALEDLPLLAVRMALLAAAVAALAGPLLVTAVRRQEWDRRIARAVVRETVGARLAPAEEGRPLQRSFEAASLSDGIRRAILWLETAPPARHEIVIASPFPIGSITQADVAAIPAGTGVRFERSGALPAARTVPAGRVLTATAVRALEVTLTGDQTSVGETAAADRVVWPIDVVSSTDDRPAIDAAIAAVLSQRVWAGPPERRARVVLVQGSPPPLAGNPGELQRDTPNREQREGGNPAVLEALSVASPISTAWMADAVARASRDLDLQTAAAQAPAGLTDARFATPPWQALASAGDGHPLAAAAASADRLLIATAAPAANVATPLLFRAIANAMAAVADLQRAEVVPISDAVLQRWSRPPAPVTSPRTETVDHDDRRWLWLAALLLLALETWIRRARPAERSQTFEREQARVA